MSHHLVDTSVWIEWLRKTESNATRAMRRLREDPSQIAVTQPVAMEVRAGTKRVHMHAVDRVLSAAIQLSVAPEIDFDVATDLYLAARDRGTPIRSLMDCVIAAVAVRTEAVLVHRDRDFEVLAVIARDLHTWSTLDEAESG